ncbi:hypothetical protein ACQY1Q_01035 [Tenacibaculum sp. TC6]|uniref:hypothetical protein n=1 Tax=Tenacibaculum sp. TC6 TaxID=3423223 RepID=UPI003D36F972
MKLLEKQSSIALSYFFMIAVLGVLLRSFSVIVIPFNYRYLVHTHSHIALLGWVYTSLMVLGYTMFLSEVKIKRNYIAVFWSTQITIIGMLVTFPLTGYALFSIFFSTAFLIASYVFSFLIFKHTPVAIKKTNAYQCYRIALVYMILSSLGPWSLGIIMNTLGENSGWYRNAIYFYLHFQYNGWFILALFSVLFYTLEQQKIYISNVIFNSFFKLLNIGVVLTFAISLLWMKIGLSMNIIAGIGAVLQLLAFVILLKELQRYYEKLKGYLGALHVFFVLLTFFYSIKLILQGVGVFPYFSDTISGNISFIIGYLHWIFLGVVSLGIFIFLKLFELIKLPKIGIWMFIIGFIISEGLLFYKGFMTMKNEPLTNNFNYFLLVASFLLLISVGYILGITVYKKKHI